MAIITGGKKPRFSGKLGNIDFKIWKDIEYGASRPLPRGNKDASYKQLVNQSKMSIVSPFVSQLLAPFNIGFKTLAIRKTANNCANSHIWFNALAGTYPNFNIDYTKVLVSNGNLPGAVAPTAALTGDAQLTFNWEDNIGAGMAKTSDKAFFVVYCAETRGSLYSIGDATRGGLTGNFDASLYKGQTLHTYIGFITADGKQAAPSVYTGTVAIPA